MSNSEKTETLCNLASYQQIEGRGCRWVVEGTEDVPLLATLSLPGLSPQQPTLSLTLIQRKNINFTLHNYCTALIL